MKRGDLVVGGEYRLQPGSPGGDRALRGWSNSGDFRCIVLETDAGAGLAFCNRLEGGGGPDRFWVVNEAARAAKMGTGRRDRSVQVLTATANRRVLVAVAVPVIEVTITRYKRVERAQADTLWVPYAAATKDILEPWSDFERRQEMAARLHETAEKLQAQREAEREAQRQADREAREAERLRDEARREASQHWYDTLIAPELERAVGDPAWSVSPQYRERDTATVTFTFDQAQRLVACLKAAHRPGLLPEGPLPLT